MQNIQILLIDFPRPKRIMVIIYEIRSEFFLKVNDFAQNTKDMMYVWQAVLRFRILARLIDVILPRRKLKRTKLFCTLHLSPNPQSLEGRYAGYSH